MNVRNIFKRSKDNSKVKLMDALAGVPAMDPERVTDATGAMRISAAYACVRVISEAIASLPFVFERRRGAVFVPYDRSNYNDLLQIEPNSYTTAFDFMRQMVSNVLLTGNAFIIPRYGEVSSEPTQLLLVSPYCGYEVERTGYYRIDDDAIDIHDYFNEREIIRIKGATLDGIHGVSVIQFASQTLSIAATANRNTLKNYANGGTPMGILSNESALPTYGIHSTDQLQAIANRMNGALQRGDRIIVSGGKSTFIPATISAADMQFLETQKFTLAEVCRFFGVNPSMIYSDTASNYKSSENANSDFLNKTLNPWLVRIEQEFTRKFLTIRGRRNFRFHFDREQMFVTDLPSMNAYVKGRIENGTMSINEGRRFFNQSQIDGGDRVFVSANLKPVDEHASEKRMQEEVPGDINETEDNNNGE